MRQRDANMLMLSRYNVYHVRPLKLAIDIFCFNYHS